MKVYQLCCNSRINRAKLLLDEKKLCMENNEINISAFIKKTVKEKSLLIIKDFPGGISEYQLIKELQKDGCMEDFSFQETRKMFVNHFFLYHCLYEMRDELISRKEGILHISALSIYLKDFSRDEPALAVMDSLADYYKDFSNIGEADTINLDNLLDQFWHKFRLSDETCWALKVLGMPPSADLAELRKRYRKLVKLHHPDKGCTDKKIHDINHAMRIIRESLS